MIRFAALIFLCLTSTAFAQTDAPADKPADKKPQATSSAPASAPDAAFIPAPPDTTHHQGAAQPAPSSEPPMPAAAPAKNPAPSFGGKAEDAVDITADNSLEWHEDERVYIARGHAKAKKGDVTIEADILKAYDRKKPDGSSEVWRMTAEGNVKVTGKNQQAVGQTAEYDIDTRKAILKGNNLKFTTSTDTVTARDSLEYWENENRAIARGNALEVRDDRQVRADELIAQFKKNAKGELTAETMTAKGNVHITSAKNNATCDEAIYYVEPNTATLIGNVYITQGKNQLKGDRVESNFKTGFSKIMNTGHGRVHAFIQSSKGKETPAAKPGNP